MVIDAHMHNIIEPGTYSSHLNKTMTNNGIKPIRMDDNPDSMKLFRNENIAATMNALREIQKDTKKDGRKRSEESTSTDETLSFKCFSSLLNCSFPSLSSLRRTI
ncbi:hypothetical protein EQH57_0635, partial [Dictyocoela roeselum]